VPTGAILHSAVTNQVGENLGKITDMYIDVETGQIAYLVLSFDGFLGFGGKLFPISWGALSVAPDGRSLVLHVPRQVLEDAPGFDEDALPQVRDPGWLAALYRYYGFIPYRETVESVHEIGE